LGWNRYIVWYNSIFEKCILLLLLFFPFLSYFLFLRFCTDLFWIYTPLWFVSLHMRSMCCCFKIVVHLTEPIKILPLLLSAYLRRLLKLGIDFSFGSCRSFYESFISLVRSVYRLPAFTIVASALEAVQSSLPRFDASHGFDAFLYLYPQIFSFFLGYLPVLE